MIVRQMAIACLIYMALVLQPTLGSGVGHALFRPWLPGIVVLACAMLTNSTSGVVWSAMLGLGLDCLSGEPLGIHLFVATIIASGLSSLTASRTIRSLIAVISMTFFVTVTWRSLAAIVGLFLSGQAIELKHLFIRASIEGISTSILFIGILFVFRISVNSVRNRNSNSVSLANRWSMLTGE